MPVLLDFEDLERTATVWVPTGLLDIGKPESSFLQVAGWDRNGFPIGGGDGHRRAAWSMQDRATIAFFVDQVEEDLQLHFVCRSKLDQPRSVRLSVAGEVFHEQELTLQMHQYSTLIPKRLLAEGLNFLEILHEKPVVLRQPKKDTRVAWENLFFGAPTRPQPGAPEWETDQRVVALDAGTRLDVNLVAPPEGARFEVRRFASQGATPPLKLEVGWQPIGGDIQWFSGAGMSSGKQQVDLVGAQGPGRLMLRAKRAVGAPLAGTLLLQDPKVVSTAKVEVREVVGSKADAVLEEEASRRPNVVLYMIDTLRVDHLGAYGYGRATSPRFDEFASGAYLFENAIAQSPWTRASTGSILTGLWPQVHGAQTDANAVPAEAITLAERLQDLGYRTGAIVANGNVNQHAGFAQGFDDFIYLQNVAPGRLLANAVDLHKEVVAWLDEAPDDSPFFLWVFAIDPHSPYNPEEAHYSRFSDQQPDPARGTIDHLRRLVLQEEPISSTEVADLVDLYDAEIRANDESLGRLLDEMEKRGVDYQSLIVVTSDHGEEFFDHGGWEHGNTLYGEMLRVPLAIRVPGQSDGRRVSELVSHIDLTPTILDYLGAAEGLQGQGRSMMPLLEQRKQTSWTSEVLSHVDFRNRTISSLIDGDWKVIVHHTGGVFAFPELYHYSHDPGDRENLAVQHPMRALYLRSKLMRALADAPEAVGSETIDPEELERTQAALRALGYAN